MEDLEGRNSEPFPHSFNVACLCDIRFSSLCHLAYLLPQAIEVARLLVPKKAMGFSMQSFGLQLWMLLVLFEALGFAMRRVDLQTPYEGTSGSPSQGPLSKSLCQLQAFDMARKENKVSTRRF